MHDLISRQAAIGALDDNITLTGWGNSVAVRDYILRAKKRLQAIPAAQPERTGKWQITDAYPHDVYCSECHTRCAQTHWSVWEDGSLPRRFCPNCGARMEGNG